MSYSLQAAKLSGKLARGARYQCIPLARAIHQSAPALEEVVEEKGYELPERKNVHVTGLPLSATPADVWRLTKQVDGGLSNIADVKMDYHRFMPTGRAYITMTLGRFADHAVKSLRDTQVTALRVRSFLSPVLDRQRSRGTRGRAEAAERAVLDGNGLGGGIKPKGSDVVLWGLPGTVSPQALRYYLRRIKMVGVAPNGEPMCEVLKVDAPRKNFTLTSKYLIRLNSSAEAHAFVRRLHITYFLPEVYAMKYLVRARVVY